MDYANETLIPIATDFDKTWYLNIFYKPIEKIQVSIKSEKNDGCFTWSRFHIYDNISLNYSYEEKYFKSKVLRKSKYAFYIQHLFFKKNRAVYELISTNMVEPEKPQTATWRRVACWISKATRANTHHGPYTHTTHTEACKT
jgi:hypothetical protein